MAVFQIIKTYLNNFSQRFSFEFIEIQTTKTTMRWFYCRRFLGYFGYKGTKGWASGENRHTYRLSDGYNYGLAKKNKTNLKSR